MGGEKTRWLIRAPPYNGSPPRGRGKVQRLHGGAASWRITPAWAGKRPLPESPLETAEDHPRVGGEKDQRSLSVRWHLGSPPRGRGKVRYYDFDPNNHGITPAWAGKSPREDFTTSDAGDHPRVGGEKNQERSAQTAYKGSPPRGRGKASFSGNSRPGVGITPAWAGKS